MGIILGTHKNINGYALYLAHKPFKKKDRDK